MQARPHRAAEPTDIASVGFAVSVARHDLHPAGLGRSAPVGFQNSAIGPDLGFYAARSYSLMRPPRTVRRWIRLRERSATG
jgi:hypothetical protein